MIKWLISSVLPGVAYVLAKPLWLQSMFMRLDLPTFERPIKAYSILLSVGQSPIEGAERVKADFLMSINSVILYLIYIGW